jgi:hypothetical protein
MGKSLDDLVLSEVKRVFNPEFLNRLDEIILFNPLGDEDLLRIIDLLVGQINDTLIHRQVQIVLTPGSTPVDPREDVRGSQLRGAAVAPGIAKVRRRSVVGSADSGGPAAAGDAGSLRLKRRARFPTGGRSNPGIPLANPTRAGRTSSESAGGAYNLVSGEAALICFQAASKHSCFVSRLRAHLVCIAVLRVPCSGCVGLPAARTAAATGRHRKPRDCSNHRAY